MSRTPVTTLTLNDAITMPAHARGRPL